jgi:hypothetical protein
MFERRGTNRAYHYTIPKHGLRPVSQGKYPLSYFFCHGFLPLRFSDLNERKRTVFSVFGKHDKNRFPDISNGFHHL